MHVRFVVRTFTTPKTKDKVLGLWQSRDTTGQRCVSGHDSHILLKSFAESCEDDEIKSETMILVVQLKAMSPVVFHFRGFDRTTLSSAPALCCSAVPIIF